MGWGDLSGLPFRSHQNKQNELGGRLNALLACAQFARCYLPASQLLGLKCLFGTHWVNPRDPVRNCGLRNVERQSCFGLPAEEVDEPFDRGHTRALLISLLIS